MRKIITIVSFLPNAFILLLPAISGTIIDPGLTPLLFLESAMFLSAFIMFTPETTSNTTKTVINNYYNYLVFLVLLFLEIIVCREKTSVENIGYYLPGFIIDLLSPNNTALKLTSISTIFLIYLRLYQKSKEY